MTNPPTLPVSLLESKVAGRRYSPVTQLIRFVVCTSLIAATTLLLAGCSTEAEPARGIDAPVDTAVATQTPTPIPPSTATPIATSKPTPQPRLTAQAIIDRSKTVMHQLSEYRFQQKLIFKTKNLELTVSDYGNFQSPDRVKGWVEILDSTGAYISIGDTCYQEQEKYEEKQWTQGECSGSGLYTEFTPTEDTLMDLGINAAPELIAGKAGRPTAYFIDNGGSTDLAIIENTDLYKKLFLDDDAAGIPQKFRIRYWINATNFRLMDLTLSFHIPHESVTNPTEFGVKDGGAIDVAIALEFRPLTERIPEIEAPLITTKTPTPTPTPTSIPGQKPTSTPSKISEQTSIRTILVASNVDGDYDIYYYQPTQEGKTVSLFLNLTDNDARDYRPKVSPDGESVLFESDRDGDNEIYLMGVFGTDQQNLTNNPAKDTNASWSPDGSKIVFASDRNGSWSIYTMNADGSNQEELDIGLPEKETNHAVYSPSGDVLAVKTIDDGDIYLHNRYSTTSLRGLNPSFTAKVIGGLDWSPDGTKLIFHGDPDPTDVYNPSQLEIFTIATTGFNLTRLTENIEIDAFPRWATDGNASYYTTQHPTSRLKLHSYLPWTGSSPEGRRFHRLTTLPKAISEVAFDINGKSMAPVTDVAFFNTGVTYQNLGLEASAIMAYTEAIRLNPQNPSTYQYRAEAYEAIGMSTEAAADYTKANNLRAE